MAYLTGRSDSRKSIPLSSVVASTNFLLPIVVETSLSVKRLAECAGGMTLRRGEVGPQLAPRPVPEPPEGRPRVPPAGPRPRPLAPAEPSRMGSAAAMTGPGGAGPAAGTQPLATDRRLVHNALGGLGNRQRRASPRARTGSGGATGPGDDRDERRWSSRMRCRHWGGDGREPPHLPDRDPGRGRTVKVGARTHQAAASVDGPVRTRRRLRASSRHARLASSARRSRCPVAVRCGDRRPSGSRSPVLVP